MADNAAELPHLASAELLPNPSLWGHRAGNPVGLPVELAFLLKAQRQWLRTWPDDSSTAAVVVVLVELRLRRELSSPSDGCRLRATPPDGAHDFGLDELEEAPVGVTLEPGSRHVPYVRVPVDQA